MMNRYRGKARWLTVALVTGALTTPVTASAGDEEPENAPLERGDEGAEDTASGDGEAPLGNAEQGAPVDESAQVEGDRQLGDDAEPAPSSEGQFYDSIDEATVRVFAVGTVDEELYQHGRRRVRVAIPHAGHGTGFVVGEQGLVLTAHHVVEGARHVVVRLPDEGGFYPARVVISDEERDVAVLHVEADLPSLKVPADVPLRVRQPVYALGYPVDASRVHPQSARGIVAGRVDDDMLQLDMALNPGNSGGPLLDEEDRVVGMVVARGDVDLGVQGIGFAVGTDALTSAVREADRRLTAGQVPPLAEGASVSAVVVDELIQKGALHELRKAADLAEGPQRADLDRALHELTARIDDSDLLAFMSGILWNAAIAIEVLGYRDIGDVTLSDAEALALARRFRSSALDASRRAHAADPSVTERSSFVAFALGKAERGVRSSRDTEWRSRSSAPDLPSMDVGLRLGPTLRHNPASPVGMGRGSGFGLSVAPRELAIDLRPDLLTFIPVVGFATGHMAVDGRRTAERFSHRYYALELGMATQLGTRKRHFEVLAAYAPGFYRSVVDVDGARAGSATEAAWMHVRLALGYRFHWVYAGTAARVLSGPTFWFEPLTVGLTASF